MATGDTGYATDDAETSKLWGEQLYTEALAKTVIYQYVGTGDDNIFQEHTDFERKAGDEITITLRMQLDEDGRGEGEAMEGSEETLVTWTDKFLINELYNAVKTKSKVSDQRINWLIRDEAKSGLRDWWSGRLDESMANQITGTDNAALLDKRNGMNAVTAPSTNRWTFSAGAANEAALISNTFNFSLTDIDNAMAIAEDNSSAPLIRPLIIDGEPHYVCFMHPWQARDMRVNAAAGQWIDFNKGAGPRAYSENNIFTGALGVYNGVIMRKWSRLPVGGTADTRRAVLCGAQAGHVGYGQYSAGGATTWSEKLFDYDRTLGVSAGMVWGCKKAIFNAEDFGSIVISSYATVDGA